MIINTVNFLDIIISEMVKKSKSGGCDKYVARKAKTLHHEGYRGKQKIAVAYSYARKAGKCKSRAPRRPRASRK